MAEKEKHQMDPSNKEKEVNDGVLSGLGFTDMDSFISVQDLNEPSASSTGYIKKLR